MLSQSAHMSAVHRRPQPLREVSLASCSSRTSPSSNRYAAVDLTPGQIERCNQLVADTIERLGPTYTDAAIVVGMERLQAKNPLVKKMRCSAAFRLARRKLSALFTAAGVTSEELALGIGDLSQCGSGNQVQLHYAFTVFEHWRRHHGNSQDFTEKNILEIGPGYGAVARLLKARGANIATVDLEPNEKLSLYGIATVTADAASLLKNMPSESLDLVLSSNVLCDGIVKRPTALQIAQGAYAALKLGGGFITHMQLTLLEPEAHLFRVWFQTALAMVACGKTFLAAQAALPQIAEAFWSHPIPIRHSLCLSNSPLLVPADYTAIGFSKITASLHDSGYAVCGIK